MSLFKIFNTKEATSNNSSVKVHLATIHTRLVGVTLKCDKDDDILRKELLKGIISPKTELHLEYYENNGQPTYYVIMSKTGLDIGTLKAEVSKDLYHKYRGCDFIVKITELTSEKPGYPTTGCNLAIQVYR